MSVSFTELVKKKSFWQGTGKEASDSHDMGKVIVNYFIVCLKQTKQEVCAVGLLSLMPRAAGGMGRYWAEFGQEYCSILPLVSPQEYTLSPPPHSKNWLSIKTWEILSGLERWMGKGRGPRAGSGTGHGAALGRLCLEERNRAMQEQGETVPGVTSCPEGQAQLLPLSWFSFSPLLPSLSDLHAAPSLSLIQPPPLSHILCSVSLSSSARYSPPPLA